MCEKRIADETEEKRARRNGCGFGPASIISGSTGKLHDQPCDEAGGEAAARGYGIQRRDDSFSEAGDDLEKKKLEEENKLLRAKTETLQNAKNSEELYANAIQAMRKYNGLGEDDEYVDN